jgi:hypothetical protein
LEENQGYARGDTTVNGLLSLTQSSLAVGLSLQRGFFNSINGWGGELNQPAGEGPSRHRGFNSKHELGGIPTDSMPDSSALGHGVLLVFRQIESFTRFTIVALVLRGILVPA